MSPTACCKKRVPPCQQQKERTYLEDYIPLLVLSPVFREKLHFFVEPFDWIFVARAETGRLGHDDGRASTARFRGTSCRSNCMLVTGLARGIVFIPSTRDKKVFAAARIEAVPRQNLDGINSVSDTPHTGSSTCLTQIYVTYLINFLPCLPFLVGLYQAHHILISPSCRRFLNLIIVIMARFLFL